MRRIEAAPVAAAKQFGGRLFGAVFTGPVEECLRRSVDRAQGENARLRIRLRLSDCPELADLPWEFLYDKDDDWFVALSDVTPVVRYVQMPTQPRPVHVTLPLRILVIRSEPTDCPELNLAAEWGQVEAALGGLISSGAATFTELAVPTLSELRRVLLREQFHVLHYMGHGAFTEQDGGTLLFTDQAGRSVPVTGEHLSVMLRDHTSLRLAVLNACEAGRTDPADPFGGIADTLVRRGIPAVIAMQFEVTDSAAIEFAPALYGALASGCSVDAAVAEARKAVYAVSALEWATPVLYLRADDARLFDISQPIQILDHAAEGDQQLRDRRYADAEARKAVADAAEEHQLGQKNHFAGTETACREAVRLDPGDAEAQATLGLVLLETGQYEEAETALRRAVRLDPGNAETQASLRLVLLEGRKYRKSKAALREAIRLDPGNAEAHHNLGLALFITRRDSEAEAAFRKAIRVDPGNTDAHNNLGLLLCETGRFQEAEAAFREAIRVDPHDTAAIARKNLDELLNSQEYCSNG